MCHDVFGLSESIDMTPPVFVMMASMIGPSSSGSSESSSEVALPAIAGALPAIAGCVSPLILYIAGLNNGGGNSSSPTPTSGNPSPGGGGVGGTLDVAPSFPSWRLWKSSTLHCIQLRSNPQ